MRWWNRCQNFPSFTALDLVKGKFLKFLCGSVLRSLSPCAETVTPRLFVSCRQRVDRLHQRARVKPARGRGYDGGRWFLHSECCLGNHSSENGRFTRKIFLRFTIRLNCGGKKTKNITSISRLMFDSSSQELIYKAASALMAVPLPLRSTLSTGGPVPASPRPSRSSPRRSWPTEPSRPLLQMPPPLLLRGSLAGVGEIRPSPAPTPPQTGLRSDQHSSASLDLQKWWWWW